MHKILLAILLFVVFFFPKSEVFADHIPKCDNTHKEPGKVLQAFGPGAVIRVDDCPNDNTICYEESKLAVDSAQVSIISCMQSVDAPAAPTEDECKKDSSKCTKGGGQRCLAGPGTPDPNGTGILTAIGCIPTEPKALVEGLLKYGTVAAAAIAFILMLLGALGMITAEGNPEVIKNSQERFYAAIIGLLFIIFAVLLMQVIGVDILGLPGFER